MKKYPFLMAMALLVLVTVFFGCGKVVDETTSSTATTGTGGSTSTTGPSGTTSTTSSSATTTTNFMIKYPTESCTAIQNEPALEHYSSAQLLIGWDGSGSNEAFIKFDVSSISALTTIQSAILKIYILGATTPTTNIDFYNLDNNWSQTSLTWLNKPGITGARIARKTVNLLTDIDTTASIDITPLVQAWITSSGYANFGIGIINFDVSIQNYVSIGSGATVSTYKPILEIRY